MRCWLRTIVGILGAAVDNGWMPREHRRSSTAVSGEPHDDTTEACDRSATGRNGHPGRTRGVPQRRRETVEALVERSLGPAMGLCVRVFDPLGDDPAGREKARMIVMDCIARLAARGATADDQGVRRVMGRVADAGLDALVGRGGGAQVPAGIDLGEISGTSASSERLAPAGTLRYAVLQDAVAPARRIDRQVAFVVLAAGITPRDASVLLGVTPKALHGSLSRIARRIAESEGADSAVLL